LSYEPFFTTRFINSNSIIYGTKGLSAINRGNILVFKDSDKKKAPREEAPAHSRLESGIEETTKETTG
jgi:hypothetical protein